MEDVDPAERRDLAVRRVWELTAALSLLAVGGGAVTLLSLAPEQGRAGQVRPADAGPDRPAQTRSTGS